MLYVLEAYPENESQMMTMLSSPMSAVATHLLSSLTQVHVIALHWKKQGQTLSIIHNMYSPGIGLNFFRQENNWLQGFQI